MKRILKLLKGAGWLNLLGMSVAFAAIYIILVQVNYDYNYNKGIKDSDRVFVVAGHSWFEEDKYQVFLSRPFLEMALSQSPQIESYGIAYNFVKKKFALGENKEGNKQELSVGEMTTGAIKVWGLEPVAGNFDGMGKEPKIAVSESTARKFNMKLGDPIWYENYDAPYALCAIYKDLPKNSDVRNLEVVICNIIEYQNIESKNEWSYPYYVKLKDARDQENVERGIYAIARKQFDEGLAKISDKDELPSDDHIKKELKKREVKLFPINEVHYEKSVKYPNAGNKTTTITLFVIACLILLITLINYVNFFMAQVPVRLRAVNTRKILGSTRSALVFRFMAESGTLVVLSLALSFLWGYLLDISSLRQLVSCSLDLQSNLSVVLFVIVSAILMTVASSVYPALYITSFPPALALKGTMGLSQHGRRFRYFLIGFQFFITFGFIISAAFVKLQYEYMMHYDMGFDKENLFSVVLPVDMNRNTREVYENELLKSKEIKDVAWASGPIVVENRMNWGREFKGETINFISYPVSANFLKFMGIGIVEGRDFMPSDEKCDIGIFIFNQKAKQKYGITLEDKIYGHRGETDIAGFCEDVTMRPLQMEELPFAFYVYGKNPWNVLNYLYIRTQPDVSYADLNKTVREAVSKITPDYNPEDLNLRFFDEELARNYEKEKQMAYLLSLFTLVAIAISLMGIIGLLSLETAFRKKEIGVRRVHGATIAEILQLFNQRYVKILLVSFAVAAPVCYFITDYYYSAFVNRSPMHWWVFVVALLAVLLVTVTVVTLCCYKAASTNPAESIKNE